MIYYFIALYYARVVSKSRRGVDIHGQVGCKGVGCWSGCRISELDDEKEVSNQQTQNLQRGTFTTHCRSWNQCKDICQDTGVKTRDEPRY